LISKNFRRAASEEGEKNYSAKTAEACDTPKNSLPEGEVSLRPNAA
jgi:hypothetical protein